MNIFQKFLIAKLNVKDQTGTALPEKKKLKIIKLENT